MNTKNANNTQIFNNKFSFGISLEIKLEEYKNIIEEFKSYISSAYFSLPLGNDFHTRRGVIEEYSTKDATRKLYEIIKLLKSNNIKLEIVINQYNISREKLTEAVKYIQDNIEFDSICTLDEYAEFIRKHFPKAYLIYSFNNRNITYQDVIRISKLYNQVVLGRKFLRDIKMMNYIRNTGLDIKLLLNNGCSFNCGTCRAGGAQCKKVFNYNMSKYSVNELYALQSFWPFELEILNQNINIEEIKEFKISSRPCSYEYLRNCLESYIFHQDKKEEEYLEENMDNYRLWSRLAHFTPYFKELDANKIKKIKEKIWEFNIK